MGERRGGGRGEEEEREERREEEEELWMDGRTGRERELGQQERRLWSPVAARQRNGAKPRLPSLSEHNLRSRPSAVTGHPLFLFLPYIPFTVIEVKRVRFICKYCAATIRLISRSLPFFPPHTPRCSRPSTRPSPFIFPRICGIHRLTQRAFFSSQQPELFSLPIAGMLHRLLTEDTTA